MSITASENLAMYLKWSNFLQGNILSPPRFWDLSLRTSCMTLKFCLLLRAAHIRQQFVLFQNPVRVKLLLQLWTIFGTPKMSSDLTDSMQLAAARAVAPRQARSQGLRKNGMHDYTRRSTTLIRDRKALAWPKEGFPPDSRANSLYEAEGARSDQASY